VNHPSQEAVHYSKAAVAAPAAIADSIDPAVDADLVNQFVVRVDASPCTHLLNHESDLS